MSSQFNLPEADSSQGVEMSHISSDDQDLLKKNIWVLLSKKIYCQFVIPGAGG